MRHPHIIAIHISPQAILCADAGFLGLAGNAIDMDNIGIAQKAAAVIFDAIDTVCSEILLCLMHHVMPQ